MIREALVEREGWISRERFNKARPGTSPALPSCRKYGIINLDSESNGHLKRFSMAKPTQRDYPIHVLTLTLISIVAIVGFWGFNYWYWQSRVDHLESTQSDLSRSVSRILYLDELLTLAARMAVATGDPEGEYEASYLKHDPELMQSLLQTRLLAPEPDFQADMREVDLANRNLVEMERQSFAWVRQGRIVDAHAVLSSTRYLKEKTRISEAVDRMLRRLDAGQENAVRQRTTHRLMSFLIASAGTLALGAAWYVSMRGARRWSARQRRITDLLRANKQRLGRIVEMSSDGTVILDRDGRIIFANAAAARIFGMPRRKLLGRHYYEPIWTLTSMDGGLVLAEEHPAARVLRSGESVQGFQGRLERPDRIRSIVLINAAPLGDESGQTTGVVLSLSDITERVTQTGALQYQATHDVLTGLPNRILFYDRLGQAIRHAERESRPMVLLILDLDRFKEINDTMGHQNGDLLLTQVGPRLSDALRDSDTVARLGGDEFAALLPNTHIEGALSAVQKITEALEPPFNLEGLSLEIEASIGIALYPDHGSEPETLMRRADVAMYRAKATGGHCAVYTLDDDQHSPRRLALVSELRRAIENRELELHYQPKFELKTDRIIGVEALIRWRHPQYGLMTPDEFIPLAERTVSIKPLTLWVIDEALRRGKQWRNAGLTLTIAVNLSPRNLKDLSLPEQVAKLLRRHDLPASALQVEITESAILEDPTRAFDVLTAIRRMGTRIAIDDFGAGYSSLTHLRNLPVDEIKIDRSFVTHMTSEGNEMQIVRSTIDLGHNLGLLVVAEGVEDQRTKDLLTTLNCDAAQGYFLGPPVPPEAVFTSSS